MSEERGSIKVYENARGSIEKFDYYILGISAALTAYLWQVYVPQRLSFSPNTLEIIGIILIFYSFYAGLQRIEAMNNVLSQNQKSLYAKEQRGALMKSYSTSGIFNESTGDILSPQEIKAAVSILDEVIPKNEKELRVAAKRADRYCDFRNYALMWGFVALLASKLWSAYFKG